jgi:hypothetical protein
LPGPQRAGNLLLDSDEEKVMDHAVALVQAYLRVNGYFTVSEYPIIVPDGGGGYRTAPWSNCGAFGSTLDGRHGGRYFRLTLGHILEFLEAYVEHYWESLRVEESKDPALGYLILTAKAKRGGAVAPQ